MKRAPSVISLLAALLSGHLIAQEAQLPAPPAEETMIPCGTYRKIESTILRETRTVLIRVPADYDKTQKRYPVLYKLDGGRSVFLQTVGTVEYLADWKQAPDHIVVGIENTDRRRDMDPGLGGDSFIRFLAEELVPFVDANYRTSESRILCGQSASTVLALYASLRTPELFDGYVLSSFGLSEESSRQLEAALGNRLQNLPRPHWMYVGQAGDESFDKGGARTRRGLEFLESLRNAEGPALQFESRVFDDQGHVPFPTLNYGLRWMAAAKAR